MVVIRLNKVTPFLKEWGLIIFICMAFFVFPTPVWALFFYIAILPMTLHMLWLREDTAILTDPGYWIGLLVIISATLSLIWGVDQTQLRIFRYAGGGVTLSLFLTFGMLVFAVNGKQYAKKIMLAVVTCAAFNALISICIFLYAGVSGAWGESWEKARLGGWAETRHSILGSNIMAVISIMALYLLVNEENKKIKFAYFIAFLLMFCFVTLSGSRGAFLAMLCGISLFTIFLSWKFFLSAVGICSALFGAIIVAFPSLWTWIHAMLMRQSFRGEIASATISYILERPILGYGIANVGSFSRGDFTFPHNVYLSSLYYTGIVGFLFFILLIGVCFFRIYVHDNIVWKKFLFSLMVVPLVAGLTDIGQIVKGPSELWLIFWFPVIIVLGSTSKVVFDSSITVKSDRSEW